MATPKWYANGLLNLSNGGLDLDVASGYKLMLVTSSYSPTQATDNFRDDIGANEASGGTGYTAGGFTLASLALNLASLTLSWDAADISQAIVGGPFAFRYGVYYRARGGASSAATSTSGRRASRTRPSTSRRPTNSRSRRADHG
jgi:hypothetical protein